MMEVTFPWPPKELSPNARVHWSKRAKAAKAYRSLCWAIALQVIGQRKPPDGDLHLWMTFCPPDRRRRDDDNCIAAFKPGRDGLADALKIDDKRFCIHPYVSEETGGVVKIKITGGPQ